MVLEVRFPLLRVQPSDGRVTDEEHALPRLIDLCEMVVLGVEDVVDELKTLGGRVGEGYLRR